MKHLSASVYTFETLIEGNYLYIDKTEFIWKLLEQPLGIYFLSRPRRFGKSLMLSTLKAVILIWRLKMPLYVFSWMILHQYVKSWLTAI